MVLALSQSAEPHPQLPSLFAEVPSIILQGSTSGREQVLDVTSQTIPVPFPLPLLVQAVLPHIQAVLFSAWLAADLFVILHAEAVMPDARNLSSLLHALSAAMQYIPVVSDPVQAVLPHMQAVWFSA